MGRLLSLPVQGLQPGENAGVGAVDGRIVDRSEIDARGRLRFVAQSQADCVERNPFCASY